MGLASRRQLGNDESLSTLPQRGLAFAITDEKDFTCQRRYAIRKTNNNAVQIPQIHELCEIKCMQNMNRE